MCEGRAGREESCYKHQAGAGGRAVDLLRKEPRGGKGAGHGRYRAGFQWRDAWCRPYERKGSTAAILLSPVTGISSRQ